MKFRSQFGGSQNERFSESKYLNLLTESDFSPEFTE
jgi:hypothetical protein